MIRTAGWHKVALVLSKWFVKPELPLLANKAMAFHRFVTTVARQDPKIVIACVDAADVAVSSSPSVILGKVTLACARQSLAGRCRGT